MKETIINARYYIEAGLFTSREPGRYVLRAIRIEPHPEGGAVIVATDGHTMGVFHGRDAKCDEAILIDYRPEIARLAKTPKKSLTRRIRVNGELDILQDAAKTGDPAKPIVRFFDAVLAPDKGQFPDWRKVLPIAKDAEYRADYNGEYIARCALAKKEFRTSGVSIFSKDANTQAIVRTQRDDFVGIVMPMRSAVEQAYPAYVQSLLEPQTPKAEPTPLAVKKDAPRKKKKAA